MRGSFFPSSCEDAPPRLPVSDPIDRREETLLDLLPENSKRAYDMYKLVGAIVDHGEWLDLNTKYRRRVQAEDVRNALFEAYAEDTIGRIMHYVAEHTLADAKQDLTDRILTIEE